MSLSAWIVLGLIAGFISSNIVIGVDPGVVMDVIFGSALLFLAYYVVSREVMSD